MRASTTRLLPQDGWRLSAQLRDELLVLADGSVDLLTMVVVVGESCVHISEREPVLGRDLVHAEAQALVPDHDVLPVMPWPVIRGLPPAAPGVISMWDATVSIGPCAKPTSRCTTSSTWPAGVARSPYD